MADEPASADGAVISVERLVRAAKYAESLPQRPYIIVEPGGLRVSAINARNFASRTVAWAELKAEGILKVAIDVVAQEISRHR